MRYEGDKKGARYVMSDGRKPVGGSVSYGVKGIVGAEVYISSSGMTLTICASELRSSAVFEGSIG